jgi:type I restriction enzyme S subunit
VSRALADLCEAVVDCEHKTAPAGDGFALSVGTPAMKDGRLVIEACKPVSEATYAAWTRRMQPRPGDLILAREAPVGQVIRIPDGLRVCLGQRTVLIRPAAEKVVSRFLHYWLLGPDAQSWMAARAAGATVPHLNVEDIRALEIESLPSNRHLQEKAAAILGAIDDLIENDRRRIQLLEEMAKAIYREWFVRYRFPRHEDVPLVQSGPGTIPEGWGIEPLRNLVEIGRETVDAREVNPKMPAVGLEHIPREQLTLNDWGSAGEVQSRKARFRAGDVLFGKIRPYFHKVSIAPLDGICSTDAIVIRPLGPYWGLVVMIASSREFVAHATQTATGTKMPRADWKVLGDYPVAVPPEDLAEEFTDLVRTQIDASVNLMFQARRLAELRDLLLPRLISGLIDASRLDFDNVLEATG